MKEVAAEQDHVCAVGLGQREDFLEGAEAVIAAVRITLHIAKVIIGADKDADNVCRIATAPRRRHHGRVDPAATTERREAAIVTGESNIDRMEGTQPPVAKMAGQRLRRVRSLYWSRQIHQDFNIDTCCHRVVTVNQPFTREHDTRQRDRQSSSTVLTWEPDVTNCDTRRVTRVEKHTPPWG
jgi:hypothetical protein